MNLAGEATQLSRQYPSQRENHPADIENICMSIPSGTLPGLVGSDGAGKTTALRNLASVTEPTSGQARVVGFDVVHQAKKTQPLIGYMHQTFSLYSDLTVTKNLNFIADISGVSKARWKSRFEEMLDFTCLEDFTKQRSHHFSGGMGEKLLLDCALIQEPRVLLLVELTPGIDSVARRELWHILFQVILNGVTVPVSTPYMDEVERGNQGNILNEVKVLSTCASRESEDEFPFDFLEVKARPRRAIREVIGAKVDDALLQAQREQSAAAVHMSEAALDATLVQQESTQIQDDLALQAVQQQDQQNRVNTGQAEIPEQLNLPVWYFEKDDELTAAEKAVAEAEAALESELANLNAVRFSASNADFVAVEERFVEAHPEVAVARHVLDRAEQAQDSEPLRGQAQKQLDAARAELNAVQEAFNPMLTSAASQDVLEVRARVTNAKARYGAAFDGLNVLQTGENSLQVKAAQTGLAQAEAAVSQVEPGLAQAQAALKGINHQIAKATVTSPIDGLLLTRDLEVGQTVSPGSTLITIGQLDDVHLVVYNPEHHCGEINLGETVEGRVVSYPGDNNKGMVTHISDQAEFTPRSVQTVEGRSATVWAVKQLMPNPVLKIKPFMPADVTFTE